MSKDYSDLPFPYPARKIYSPHHDSLAKITYFPNQCNAADSDSEEVNKGNGRYVTCSKDGILVFWGSDLNIQRTINLADLNNAGKGAIQLWVTDVVCLANVKKIAVATTDREITFYDCSANSFDKQFVLSGIDHCVLCMDYWFNPKNLNHCCLLLGDAGGSVSCITFNLATVGLFDVNMCKTTIASSTARRISFQELVAGRHQNVNAVTFSNLHGDWVRRVKYIPNLRCFISCANTTHSSLFLGDLQSKKMKSFFKIRKGVYCFDYNKENNVIVTGGLDRNVRLWNPYVTAKATSVLKGHNSSVSHIITNGNQVISVSKDKVIKIWDIKDYCCIQTIPSRLLSKGTHPITTVYFNRKSNALLLGSNILTVLERTNPTEQNNRVEDEVRSHAKPLCGALYNDLFKQVVSACHGSVVNVWHLDTGEKAIMFKNAHDGHEITSLCFDPTKRRLITGSRNGSVRIWNFNNGACLRELPPVHDGEITGIICPRSRILTVGWNHNITVYRDVRGAEDDPPRSWNTLHKDDILAVDLMGSSQVATASYDGQVTCWNIDSGHVYSMINVNKSVRRRSLSVATLDFAKEREALKSRQSAAAESHMTTDNLNKHLSVDKILFLKDRHADKETATLLVSVEGLIQAWSLKGGLLGQFDATAQHNDESVLAMTSDEYNDVLFTGDSVGYIKIWDISKYCIKTNGQITPSSDRRSDSPLDSFNTRRNGLFAPIGTLAIPNSIASSAGSSMKSRSSNSVDSSKGEPLDNLVPPPKLLTSYRGHCSSIVSIVYVRDKQYVITASTDSSVRLWTLNGRYIGTFGQKQHWDLNPNVINKQRKIPADIKRVASTQTLKVLKGAAPKWKLAKNIFTILHLGLGRRPTKKGSDIENETAENIIDDETVEASRPEVLDISLTNILGKNYRSKQRHKLPPCIKPKIKNLQCVAFSALPFSELERIHELKMPPVLTAHHQPNRTSTPNQSIETGGARLRTLRTQKTGKVSPIKSVFNKKIRPLLAAKALMGDNI